MKVALIGATGNAGSELLKELSGRGHEVTAIARNADKAPTLDGVTVKSVDAADHAALSEAVAGHDVAISALPFRTTDPEGLIGAIRDSGVPRYLVVGGAGTLFSPGTTERIIDSGAIPEEYMAEVGGGARFLDALKQEEALDWVFLSPSMLFIPGERRGSFRLGKDELLVAEDGQSSISFADYAIAMIDEVEKPAHSRERFTVGY